MTTLLTSLPNYFNVNTKLLIHSNNLDGNVVFLDDSDIKHTITTHGNTHHETDQKKFGSSGIQFDGTGDYLTVPDHRRLKLNSNIFTIECWIRPDNITSSGILFVKSPGEHEIQIQQSSANIVLNASSNGTSWDIASSRTICTVTATTWIHFALVRNGSTWKTYKNGVLTDTLTSSSTIFDEEGTLNIGGDGTTDFEGYMDEIRILGIPEWDSNFTPYKLPYEKSINNTINLFPFSSIKEHLTKGTVKDGSDNPLVRNISSYRNNIKDSKNELLLYKTTVSDSNGDFELELNDNTIPFTIVIHGGTGENDVIYKDVMVT